MSAMANAIRPTPTAMPAIAPAGSVLEEAMSIERDVPLSSRSRKDLNNVMTDVNAMGAEVVRDASDVGRTGDPVDAKVAGTVNYPNLDTWSGC